MVACNHHEPELGKHFRGHLRNLDGVAPLVADLPPHYLNHFANTHPLHYGDHMVNLFFLVV